jgi:hypothetical protein
MTDNKRRASPRETARQNALSLIRAGSLACRLPQQPHALLFALCSNTEAERCIRTLSKPFSPDGAGVRCERRLRMVILFRAAQATRKIHNE